MRNRGGNLTGYANDEDDTHHRGVRGERGEEEQKPGLQEIGKAGVSCGRDPYTTTRNAAGGPGKGQRKTVYH